MITMEEIPVKVAVRVRPLLSKEILHNHQVCVRLVPNTQQLIIGKDRGFTFDFVFGKTSTQDDVYNSCIKPLLVSLIEGYNATVFAYGQTGSGKTYTIGGGHVASVADEEKGIIPRAIHELFQSISENHNIDFSVKVSYIEVYKEELRDLLELETNVKDLHIREDEKGNTVIIGAKECQVESADEIMSLLESGSAARHTGTTQMNEHSSRSHAIFTIAICQERPTKSDNAKDGSTMPAQMITSKFHFVDLAGSERVTKTGNTGERFKESIQINSGLLALGNVISALSDPKRKGAHIPYRDAKITRILKDSLGGNAKTVMITCISPSSSDFDESLNSLKYANRARNIKNKPIVNYNPDWDRMDEMELEIKALREALQNQQSSRLGRTSQVSEEWNQDKNKIISLEEQLARLEEACLNHQHCTEEAMSLLLEFKGMSGLKKKQQRKLHEWLNMAKEIKNETAAVSRPETSGENGKEEPNHITILQLKRELKKCQDALATDEEVFGKKELELKKLQEEIQSLIQENQERQKSLYEAQQAKNLQNEKLVEQQLLIDELQNKLETMSHISSSRVGGKEEDMSEETSKRPHSVPLKNDSQLLSLSVKHNKTQPEPRKVQSSPPSYSLERVVAGFRTRSQMILDLIEEQDEVLHEKFSDEEVVKEDKESQKKSTFRRSINRTWTRRQSPLITDNAGEKNKPLSRTASFSNSEVATAIQSLQESRGLNMKKLKSSELRLAQANHRMRELSINIKMKEDLIEELMKTGNDAQSVNKQFYLKIKQLEQEVQQAKVELTEAQKQLQEVENKELKDVAQKAKLQRDFRKKMDAAKLKVQVLQQKQQDTKKLETISVNNEKRLVDLEQNVDHMRQQKSQLQKRLQKEAEQKKKLESEIQKDQQQIKELQLKTEWQQKKLKQKSDEIAAMKRRMSAPSISDQLQQKLEEQKKWLDEEVEKVLKERQALEGLEEDLKKREESIQKKELLLQERSQLEIKKLRCSQALNNDMLKLSTRLSVLEQELTDKSQKLESSNDEDQRKVSEDLKVLHKERDHLLQRRDSLDEKLKLGRVLSPEEEHTLFQLEEGIDALEAAIEYKNECIQNRQQTVKEAAQILSQSEANVIEKFNSLSPYEIKSILIRYFNKVVALREKERKMQVQLEEMAMKVSEQENIVRELEAALEHLTLQSDRRLIQQQKEQEQRMQLLLQHFKDNEMQPSEDKIKANEAKIEELEKELFFYKKTSRDLKKKLREVIGDANAPYSKSSNNGNGLQNQDETTVAALEEQKWASNPENIKQNRKPKETESYVPNIRLQNSTYRVVGNNSEAAESSDSRRQYRRQMSIGDNPEDVDELYSAKALSVPNGSSMEPNIRMTPVRKARRDLRQISVSQLSTRRTSFGSIPADSIELARRSTDFKN
ncbi:kinesin-like protein KIF27 [Discoglossus pictus]